MKTLLLLVVVVTLVAMISGRSLERKDAGETQGCLDAACAPTHAVSIFPLLSCAPTHPVSVFPLLSCAPTHAVSIFPLLRSH